MNAGAALRASTLGEPARAPGFPQEHVQAQGFISLRWVPGGAPTRTRTRRGPYPADISGPSRFVLRSSMAAAARSYLAGPQYR